MKQILAELALLDPLFQVLVGGGDHAHVGLDRLMATDPVKESIRQHTQQAGLQIWRHVADFIEKQCTVFSLLEAALALGVRAGKGAALMAEQLGFEQILRNRCRVDGDEWLV